MVRVCTGAFYLAEIMTQFSIFGNSICDMVVKKIYEVNNQSQILVNIPNSLGTKKKLW